MVNHRHLYYVTSKLKAYTVHSRAFVAEKEGVNVFFISKHAVLTIMTLFIMFYDQGRYGDDPHVQEMICGCPCPNWQTSPQKSLARIFITLSAISRMFGYPAPLQTFNQKKST